MEIGRTVKVVDGCFEHHFSETLNTRSGLSERILHVLNNFSSHVCEHTCKRVDQFGIDLMFLPIGLSDLNPIE